MLSCVTEVLLFYHLEIIIAAFFIYCITFCFCVIAFVAFPLFVSLCEENQAQPGWLLSVRVQFFITPHTAPEQHCVTLLQRSRPQILLCWEISEKAQQQIPQLFSLVHLTQYKKEQEECGEQPRGISVH